MYPVNPSQLIQMIKSGYNPQQLMMSVLEGRISETPMGANLLTLAKNGNQKGIEEIARNMSVQRGIDFDKEFTAFKQMLGVLN